MEQTRFELNNLELGYAGLQLYLMKADYMYTKDVKFFVKKGGTQSAAYVRKLLDLGVAESVVFKGRKYIQIKDDYLKKIGLDRDPSFFLHNLTTTSFLAGVKRILPDSSIYWGKENKNFLRIKKEGKTQLFPDAFFYNDENKCFAVEVELSQKTDRRIIQKIQNYIENNDEYFKVVYIFSNSHIKEKYMGFIKEAKRKYQSTNNHTFLEKLKGFFILVETQKLDSLAERIHILKCVTSNNWENEYLIESIKGGSNGN